MDEINKDFDGVSWEWRGKTFRGLKPICPKPKCLFELDIEITELDMKIHEPTEDKSPRITLTSPHVIYSCPKCSFSINTTIDDVNSPRDLRKAVRKEFEHRQRLKTSENIKD